MQPIFYDTETCGLHGPIVLLQWAEGDGEIQLHSPWSNTIRSTIELIEKIVSHPGGVVGFNLAFDHFHLIQMYTVLILMKDWDEILGDCVDEYAELEPLGRDGPCLKPVKAHDVMLHARRGPYQSMMNRGDIRIRRVPTALAWNLAKELEQRIKLKDIYFARRKDKFQQKWQVFDIQDEDGEDIKDFKDVVLKFAPSSALKALATDALNLPVDTTLLFTDVEVDPKLRPVELGYAPFAKAICKGAWPEVLRFHTAHWQYYQLARTYAKKDVEYTRSLYKFFGSPELGDDDSELACMVAAVRWRGYKVDINGLKELRAKAIARKKRADGIKIPVAPSVARIYVTEVMHETERLIVNGTPEDGNRTERAFQGSTKKVLLEDIAKNWRVDCVCNGENKSCSLCDGTGLIPHPSAVRAREVLDARQAGYEEDFYDKLILAGRFHASVSVIGALSTRMGGGGSSSGIEQSGFAGGDGLNAQGIKKDKEVRAKFPLAFSGMKLSAGDFAGYEVTIAESVYNDENLRNLLLTCERCRNRMKFVLEKTRVDQIVSQMPEYIKWRLKAEAEKKSEKLESEILNECIEGNFICTTCGSSDGMSFHAIFGLHFYPEFTYESLKATGGTKEDKYTKAKSGAFATFYGGTIHTLMDRLGLDEETATKALASFHRQFPGVRRFQQDIINSFCSMRQPGGLRHKVIWNDPAEYRETMFGFRRYFTIENMISKELFRLANEPPKSWRDIKIKVLRRDRFQTASGAVQSALYGAAFQTQAACMRAAANHDIQSAGATITKMVQRKIWDIQPSGVHKWLVQPLNIHDEIECPCVPEVSAQVARVVKETVESVRPKVPLIRMDWKSDLNSWADKS